MITEKRKHIRLLVLALGLLLVAGCDLETVTDEEEIDLPPRANDLNWSGSFSVRLTKGNIEASGEVWARFNGMTWSSSDEDLCGGVGNYGINSGFTRICSFRRTLDDPYVMTISEVECSGDNRVDKEIVATATPSNPNRSITIDLIRNKGCIEQLSSSGLDLPAQTGLRSSQSA